MAVAEQRRSPRYPADWTAQYRYDTAGPWRACRVIDVSLDGAAVELYDDEEHEPEVGRFYLQVCSAVDGEVGVTVRATLRRHLRRDNGQLLAGIEFAPLPPVERNLLQLLVSLRTFA
jgi:hypothetical protein